jgi:2-methylaconitate cis-trans-isomerase PrpF
MGLVEPASPETTVRIHAVNTGALIDAVVQTPDGRLAYDGSTVIAGVPGSAAPIALNFMDVVGSSTGSLLPTGQVLEMIGGIEVTCMDVAMPIVIARAADLGLSGYESAAELDENKALFTRIEAVRIEAGKRMGMGDVRKSVTPKFAILAPPREGGAIAARYFMPWNCHPSMAVTGAQCLASSVLAPGTVANGIGVKPDGNPATLVIEHPSGSIEVTVDYASDATPFTIRTAGLIRTARLLARGEVMIPGHVWDGFGEK